MNDTPTADLPEHHDDIAAQMLPGDVIYLGDSPTATTDTPTIAGDYIPIITGDFLLDYLEKCPSSPSLTAEQKPAVPGEEHTSPEPQQEDRVLPSVQEEESCATEPREKGSALQTSAASAVDFTPITRGLDDIMTRLSGLSDDFARKLRYDESKQTIIDRQHAELERYRRDEAFKLSKAIIMDVISEVDSAEKNSKFYENLEDSPENYAKLRKLVLGISDDLRDLLERNDIFAYRSEPGSSFDAKRQRVLKTVPTGDEALAKTIHESVRWGFESADKVVRHELVNVYAYDPKLAAAQAEEGKPADNVQASSQSDSESASEA